MQDKKSHSISVSDFISSDFITVKTDDSLVDIIKKILRMDLNSTIVMENNSTEDIPVGIIKLKDILRTVIDNHDKIQGIVQLNSILKNLLEL